MLTALLEEWIFLGTGSSTLQTLFPLAIRSLLLSRISTDVKFKTFGCGAAVATSSIATEMIKGKKLEDALKLTNKAVVEALDGLPPAKLHCSVLAEEAMKALFLTTRRQEY